MTNRLQPVYDIAALCAASGLRQAVLCPGSRNAPLVLAFARHPDIRCRSVSDERSAAFIALGIAQQTLTPAVLVSTSGSAAYNFGPAVAEAFFAKTALMVITADRPTEWIGQQDGQTIFQQGIFGSHVKRSFNLPQEYEHIDNQWAINRMINEAINLARQEPPGPVHVNVPLREPLYPGSTPTPYSPHIRTVDDPPPAGTVDPGTGSRILAGWHSAGRILVVAGQQRYDGARIKAVDRAIRAQQLPLVADALSNLHPIGKAIRSADLFLGGCPEAMKEDLRPELLITFGDSVISKNLKLFLRAYSPRVHWHIQPAGDVADTFRSVTSVFRVDATAFFDFIAAIPRTERDVPEQADYTARWEAEERRAHRVLDTYFPFNELGELEVVLNVLRNLPPACNLHLANSMSVRYAALAGITTAQAGVRVYANRGTSGIDGCTSTAVGHALSSQVPNILITGDLAFFYDRNAFWHNYSIPNLRILLLNNHGGAIFRMIDGPGDVEEADEYLVTRQPLNGRKLCEEFGIEYLTLDTRRKMVNVIRDLLEPSDRPKVLELETSIDLSKQVLHSLKQKIKESYEQ